MLNLAVFGMRAQEAVESARFNSNAYRESFRDHSYAGGGLQVENRIEPSVVEALTRLGHRVGVIGPFMMNTAPCSRGSTPRTARSSARPT